MIDDQETKLIGEIDTIFLQTQQADNPIQHLESALNNLKINLSNSFSDIRETTVAKINTNEITFTPEKRFLYNENGIGMSILQQKMKRVKTLLLRAECSPSLGQHLGNFGLFNANTG